MSQKHWR